MTMYLASLTLHNSTVYLIVAILACICLIVWLIQHFR